MTYEIIVNYGLTASGPNMESHHRIFSALMVADPISNATIKSSVNWGRYNIEYQHRIFMDKK